MKQTIKLLCPPVLGTPGCVFLGSSPIHQGLSLRRTHVSHSQSMLKTSPHSATFPQKPVPARGPSVCKRWFPNSGSSLVQKAISAPQFYLNLPLFYLNVTSFLPHFNLCSAGNLEPRFGNRGLQSLGRYDKIQSRHVPDNRPFEGPIVGSVNRAALKLD